MVGSLIKGLLFGLFLGNTLSACPHSVLFYTVLLMKQAGLNNEVPSGALCFQRLPSAMRHTSGNPRDTLWEFPLLSYNFLQPYLFFGLIKLEQKYPKVKCGF